MTERELLLLVKKALRTDVFVGDSFTVFRARKAVEERLEELSQDALSVTDSENA